MGKYIALGLITAILALSALWAFDPSYQQQRQNTTFYASEQQRLDLERKQLDLDRARLQAQIEAQHAPAAAQAWSMTEIALILSLPVALAALGVAAATFFRRQLQLVRPDVAGRLPAVLASPEYGDMVRASLAGFHTTQYARAVHQPGQTPASVSTHYAPQFRNEQRSAIDGATGLPLLPLDQVLGVPTFAQLLDQGRIGRGQSLLLGVDEAGEEVAGSWLDLYSTIVSGLPGSGKTTSQRFLACQTALQGARFVIVDPHAGAADDSLAATLQPLSSAFLCAPASDDKAILSAVQLVADIGERRVKGKDMSTYPIILWLDETTKLLSRSTVAGPLATLLEGIAQEYRKKNVFACASGQIWSASRTGDDSALRDSFASVLCHRMKRSQARLLIPTDEAQTVERLSTGQAVLWRTSGETSVISVPNTTAHDVVRVAGLLTDNAPTLATLLATPVADTKPESSQIAAENVADVKPDRSRNVPETARLHSASQSGMSTSPEAARAVALFLGGASIAEVVKELRGVGSGEGSRYQKALGEVQALLREGMSGAA